MSMNIASGVARGKSKICWLDLRRAGISVIERLAIEEALLRHDPQKRQWAIVGVHDPCYSRSIRTNIPHKKNNCVIVLGIGGKPEELLNLDLVERDAPLLVKRFSGGGTVVIDHSSLLTTFIGRTADMPQVEPYPRNIMQWSADIIFGPAFASMNKLMSNNNFPAKAQKTLVMEKVSCGLESNGKVLQIRPNETQSSKRTCPDFALHENDYVIGNHKIAGNAQAIIKGGWLHHTSFLWDYVEEHMLYLEMPRKRPQYRQDRSHDDFLLKLNTFFGDNPKVFFETVKEATAQYFELEEVSLKEALNVVNSESLGGMQKWFDGKCRTRIISLNK